LPEPHRLIRGPLGSAQPRQQRPGAFDAAHCFEEIEEMRLLLQLRERRYKMCRWPSLAGHRMISPRSWVLSTRRVKLFKDT
jgi:hypothetical protein